MVQEVMESVDIIQEVIRKYWYRLGSYGKCCYRTRCYETCWYSTKGYAIEGIGIVQ